MSSTLAELERKLNVAEVVRDHPWPALALAFGAGVLLSGSASDIKAAAATVTATKGASSRIGMALDDMVATLVGRRSPGGRAARHRLGRRDQRSDRRAAARSLGDSGTSRLKRVLGYSAARLVALSPSRRVAESPSCHSSKRIETRLRAALEAVAEVLRALILRAVTLPSQPRLHNSVVPRVAGRLRRRIAGQRHSVERLVDVAVLDRPVFCACLVNAPARQSAVDSFPYELRER
jgi:hypothetical protein